MSRNVKGVPCRGCNFTHLCSDISHPSEQQRWTSSFSSQFQVRNHLWATEVEVKEMQGRGDAGPGTESRVMPQACSCMLICMSSMCCCKEVQFSSAHFLKNSVIDLCSWHKAWGKVLWVSGLCVYLPHLKPDCCLAVKWALYLVSRVSLQLFPILPCCLNLAKLFSLSLVCLSSGASYIAWSQDATLETQ